VITGNASVAASRRRPEQSATVTDRRAGARRMKRRTHARRHRQVRGRGARRRRSHARKNRRN
jgi:hypothetical protein